MPTMKAMEVTTPKAPFELVQREIPTPAARWVRIKVEACGVCHSDLFAKAGAYPGLQLPRMLGAPRSRRGRSAIASGSAGMAGIASSATRAAGACSSTV